MVSEKELNMLKERIEDAIQKLDFAMADVLCIKYYLQLTDMLREADYEVSDSD